MSESERNGQGAIPKRSPDASLAGTRGKRSLHSYQLEPPDYKISPQLLLDGFMEKEVKFLGNIQNVPIDLDMTRRTEVLRLIDMGKRDWPIGPNSEAIISLSALNLKLSRRDVNEELILRLALHEIAAVCYIRDDADHFVAIKHGNLRLSEAAASKLQSASCSLAVILCDSKGCAEEICAIVSQCFQIIYTDAVVQLLDNSFGDLASNLSTTPSEKIENAPRYESLFPSSFSRSYDTSSTRTPPHSQIDTIDSYNVSREDHNLLQQYMNKLSVKLNVDELRRFAQLLKLWWNAGMPFVDFCENVFELYGSERKHLLTGLRPFIPDGDCAYFERFLIRVGITESDTISLPQQRKLSLESSVGGALNGTEAYGAIADNSMTPSSDYSVPYLQKTT